ncbi:MAG TPA: FxLYD domain-containing protein [Methanolinea sp.]|nr:FxLYD domain-containing protein [Methanolinea sp.]HQK55913.1 FxLYD domain-containing protein [Methanolinea sp.]
MIKTPYGYLITTPTTGVRLSVIEIKDDVDATGQRIIIGKIKNDESYRIDHITVNFNLYNSNGNLLGNTYASVNSLGPGKVWRFSTQPFAYRDYQYYEMSGIFTA